ncbi:MAG TPA: PhzF family phenazine biosynthesis protein [Actinomycetales bacterium]|nr:PhzF family phenazine biosynthesis protein [Actinomycetales bacterium]
MTTRTWADHDELEFDVVDVFTTTAFAGNGLAVVYGAESLTTQQLQALAREFNLSETAFPVPPGDVGQDVAVDADADYGLRIFTPETELPFAGHPSVGAAWALCRRGLLTPGRRGQLCRAGLVELETAGPDDVVWLTGRPPVVGGEIDPAGPLAAVGLGAIDQVGVTPVVAGAGLDFSYLFVRPGSIARAVPDLQQLRRLRTHGPELGGVVIVGWHDGTARVRVFTDDIGATEDPATGSAALGLGAVLVHAGLLAGDGTSTFTVRQGIEIGRPSTLYGEVRAQAGVPVQCRVGGTVVPVSRGTIAVPPRATSS